MRGQGSDKSERPRRTLYCVYVILVKRAHLFLAQRQLSGEVNAIHGSRESERSIP